MKTPEEMYYEWRQAFDKSLDEGMCKGKTIGEQLLPRELGKEIFLAGYQAAKDQLQPQPFHAGADVYIIDANNPLPKPMPLSIAEQEKPRFEFKPLEYCGDDEVLREMFSLPTNYWMTEQELKECGLQAVVADQPADAGKVMNSPKKLDSWISVNERLPEEDTGVLAFINYTVENEPVRRVTSGAFRGGLWLTDNEILAHPLVSHWMPLPTPPEE